MTNKKKIYLNIAKISNYYLFYIKYDKNEYSKIRIKFCNYYAGTDDWKILASKLFFCQIRIIAVYKAMITKIHNIYSDQLSVKKLRKIITEKQKLLKQEIHKKDRIKQKILSDESKLLIEVVSEDDSNKFITKAITQKSFLEMEKKLTKAIIDTVNSNFIIKD